MNHLQVPQDALVQHSVIPYLGLNYSEDYCIHQGSGLCDDCKVAENALGWEGFPARMGWDSERVFNGHLSRGGPVSSQEPAMFLQAWLYLGILFVFFEDQSIISKFLKETDMTTTVIDTMPLNQLLQAWRHTQESATATVRRETLSRINNVLSQLDQLCTVYFAGVGYVEGVVNPLPDEISLSIMVLGETLNHATYMAGGGKVHYTFGLGKTKALELRLESRFWCIKDINNLGRISLTYYASLMRPRYPSIVHKDCRDDYCSWLNLDEDRYEVKHTTDGCSCGYVPSPTDKVIAILNKGEIPVLIYSPEDNQLQCFSSTVEKSYLAISHVWADGLGNPKTNSLPSCQLLRLHSLITRAFPQQSTMTAKIPFWMDTLCVPITDDGTARKLAISKIIPTFEGATVTLVIDAELMQISKQRGFIELALRILWSRWAQRLWTLAEAVASSSFIVQFADGLVDAKQLETELFTYGEDAGINDMILMRAFKWFRDISRLRNTTDQDERLVRTFQSTLERSTSHERDEVICTAGLVSFDEEKMLKLLDSPEDGRVATFMKILGKAPKTLVFASGPRLREHGFCWCPRHLLSAWRRVSSNHLNARFHEVTEDGLRGMWRAIKFNATAAEIDKASTLQQEDFILRDCEANVCHWVTPIDMLASEALRTATSQSFALLLEDLSLFQQDFCCLVEITRTEGTIIFARFIARCFVQLDQSLRTISYDTMAVIDLDEQTNIEESTWCLE